MIFLGDMGPRVRLTRKLNKWQQKERAKEETGINVTNKYSKGINVTNKYSKGINVTNKSSNEK